MNSMATPVSSRKRAKRSIMLACTDTSSAESTSSHSIQRGPSYEAACYGHALALTSG